MNTFIKPLLSDMYQYTMAYAYFKAGMHESEASFELFFRKAPFKGEYAIFAGLGDCLKFLESFDITESDIAYLREQMPYANEDYFEYLRHLDCSRLCIKAIPEGDLCFPRVPLLMVSGPLILCQLVETTFLVLINYATLVATNACRMRQEAGHEKVMLEFGLRRAQGPDGGMSAARYAVMGGFDGSSNILAGKTYGLNISGTHAHSFVQSFGSLDDLPSPDLHVGEVHDPDFKQRVLDWRKRLGFEHTSDAELAAFICYAQAHAERFLALVDTYDTLSSGVPNFLAVSCALSELGIAPKGIRLDSGDLSYLSNSSKAMFRDVAKRSGFAGIADCQIAASNDISESVLHSLNAQGHSIDIFGIGTKLVTCSAQPALGGVYKLVELGGSPRIKLSQDRIKITIPGSKTVYRLHTADGPYADLMCRSDEPAPEAGKVVLCIHPANDMRRVRVKPARVEVLHRTVWDGGLTAPLDTFCTCRERVRTRMAHLRGDHKRGLNPTPYKVSISDRLNARLRDLMLEAHAPKLVE
eukprot:gnl/Dysnectes_brevis/2906_a3555_701.p1 GENE.gnl/Dysnectes_brevis/2906_a3555_701~~gnl/Dysnectes_brevis/2906_a3555_701.p1  ORF type:complete len:526 (+),score=190.29 gnl/Dysnectes_brevis/2906_a3555_701:77-1654(+)